jgi:hypothetical protein
MSERAGGYGEGHKHDAGKADWSLLPLASLEPVVRVLEFGAAKYAREGWRSVPDAKRRYFAAALRHLAKHQAGEAADAESGISHLAHAACNLLFLLHFEASP